ncbi:MAG: hypothetical protein ACRD5L_07470, partial [Bryobacteraceae bacterium]
MQENMIAQNSAASPDAGARPLRVLFIIDKLGVGGAELCLTRLIRHLPRDQFQCRLLTFESTRDLSPLLDEFDCPIDC